MKDLHILEKFDILSEPIKLNFKGKQMHVTKVGGVLSIATIVLILSYFLIQFIQLLQGENPTITTSLVT